MSIPTQSPAVIDVNTQNLNHMASGAVATEQGPLIASTLFAGLFTEGSEGHALYTATNWDTFTSEWNELSGQGLRLVGINTHLQRNEETRYTGTWVEGNGTYAL